MGLGCVLGVGACSAPQEAEHVELTVETDATQLGPVTTNLGYSVELTEARIMVRDLTFATGGDLLTRSFVERTYDWLIPTAHAHPGHFEGGDVTGELPGALVLDFLPGQEQTLGTATFLAGDYRSANMTFGRAASSDVENQDDPLLGHTAILRGTAKSDDKTVEFFVLVAIEDGTALMGIPFEAHIDGSTGHSLGVQLRALDEIEGDTLFDDVDFALLDDNHDGHITISPEQTSKTATEAHSTLSRALLVHDFYAIKLAK
ncbi:MAG TPA: hypothetical protein VN764_01185 [Polyangiaceae bacterium]|nr:hypothetical protein [Polyangiaceae bacterium]